MGIIPEGESNVLAACETALALHLMSFIKPFDVHRAKDDPQSFYMEREWRKHGNLQFDESHVGTVYVASSFLKRARVAFPRLHDRIWPLD